MDAPVMLKTLLKQIGNDTTGATAVEYGLIISLIVLAMFSALQAVATETNEYWDTVSEESVEAMSN